MDHGRKIGKPKSYSKTMKSRSLTYCTAFDPPVIPDEPVIEDRRLINWKKWLGDRDKHYERYKSITGRHQTKLIMNSSERYRDIVEMRDLMDSATITVPETHDKYRGNPAFFKIPNYLSNRKPDCSPDIFVTLTKKELNIPPELTRVTLPSLMEKEKNLVYPKKYVPTWRRNEYLQKREEELAETISVLRPNEPDARELTIKGERFGVEKSKNFQRFPVITISDRIEEEVRESVTKRSESAILRIQEREIVRDNDSSRFEVDNLESREWKIVFVTTCGDRTEDKIVLENKGTVVIEYQWREEFVMESVVPLTVRKGTFHFDKNNGSILPGQIIQIPIWFCTSVPGVHMENWRLETEPELRVSSIQFRFCGYASSTELMYKSNNAVDEYLNDRIKKSTITEIIKDLVNGVRVPKSEDSIYSDMFLERDLYLGKNPLCYYHTSIVHELRSMYSKATRGNDWPTWNFSLTDLRDVLLRIDDPYERQETLLRFGRLIDRSLKPNVSVYDGNDKYAAVYNILCSFVNKFECESQFVRESYASDATLTSCDDTDDPSRSRKASTSISTGTVRRTKVLSRTLRVQDSSSILVTRANDRILEDNNNLYGQIYFVRIYGHLGDAIDRACATIDSLNNLNEFHK